MRLYNWNHREISYPMNIYIPNTIEDIQNIIKTSKKTK